MKKKSVFLLIINIVFCILVIIFSIYLGNLDKERYDENLSTSLTEFYSSIDGCTQAIELYSTGGITEEEKNSFSKIQGITNNHYYSLASQILAHERSDLNEEINTFYRKFSEKTHVEMRKSEISDQSLKEINALKTELHGIIQNYNSN